MKLRVEQEGSGAPTCTPIFEKKFEARVKVVAPHHGGGGKTDPSSTSISLLLRAKLPNYRVGVPCGPVLDTSGKGAVLPPLLTPEGIGQCLQLTGL